nr:putative reverse transcriptase domain-containing protein [Tanacetum cinerariifolium]
MEFQVKDKVMLKVSPWKRVVRFGKRGKLNPRYVGPFKVLERVGDVAYKLDLPEELSIVHNTFYVSNLKKCHTDEPLAVPLDGLHFDDKLHFVEEPVEIMDREVKQLKRSRIPLVKDQPLPADASPTTLLSGYIADSNPKEYEEEPEEDPADYPVDKGDNDDNGSSDDDEDDDNVKKDEKDEEEEEENLPLADPSAETMITVNQGMSVEEVERVLEPTKKGYKVPRAHTAWPINKKAYARSLPLCNQCKFHHNGPCNVKCKNCKKVGHIIQNYRTPATTRNQRTRTYYECGSLRHYWSECQIVKFQKCVDMIHRGVRASKPKNNQNQQQQNKRQSTSRLTLQGTGRRNMTSDLNATIAMMVHVLPNATSATELAIWPVTVGVVQMPILLTTKGALGQGRRLLAMNVRIKGTT